MAYRIKCVDIDKGSKHKDCRKIKFLGIPVEGGGVNRYTPAQMYDRISKEEEFYVLKNGSKVYLVKVEREGTKYVRTEPNDTENDNLLQQDSC